MRARPDRTRSAAALAALTFLFFVTGSKAGPESPPPELSSAPEMAPLRRFDVEGERFEALAFAKFGARVVTSTATGEARLRDSVTGKMIGRPLDVEGIAERFIFSNSGERLITFAHDPGETAFQRLSAVGSRARLKIWDTRRGRAIGPRTDTLHALCSLKITPDEKRLVIVSAVYRDPDRTRGDPTLDIEIHIRNLRTGAAVGALLRFQGVGADCDPAIDGAGMQFSADGAFLIAVSIDSVFVVNTRTGKARRFAVGAQENWRSSAINGRGTRIVREDFDGRRLREASTDRAVGGKFPSGQAFFNADGSRFVIGCSRWAGLSAPYIGGNFWTANDSPKLYDSETGDLLADLGYRCDAYHSRYGGNADGAPPWPNPPILDFSPDGKKLMSSTADYGVQLWNAATGVKIGAPLTYHAPVIYARADFEAGLFAGVPAVGPGLYWRFADEEPPLRLRGGRIGVLSRRDDQNRVVNRQWSGLEGGGPGVIFRPDQRRILTMTHTPIVAWAQLWDAETGGEIGAAFPLAPGSDAYATFSADGRVLATSSPGKMICLWDIVSGAPIGGPLRHGDWPTDMAFDESGAFLAVASVGDGGALWSVEAALASGAGPECASGPAPAPLLWESRYRQAAVKMTAAETKGARILIYNGTPALKGEFNAVAALLHEKLCTGTLISQRIILTAAHCLVGARAPASLIDAAQSYVASGRAVFGNSAFAPVRNAIADAVVHPSYTSDGRGADLALLLLQANPGAEPVGLAPEDWVDVAPVGRIVGFGSTELKIEGDKLWADAPIVSPRCAGETDDGRSDSEAWGCRRNEELVARSYDAPFTDTCGGDSGGPLFVVAPSSAQSLDAIDAAVKKGGYGVGAVISRGVRSYCGGGGIYRRLTPDMRAWLVETATNWGETLATAN